MKLMALIPAVQVGTENFSACLRFDLVWGVNAILDHVMISNHFMRACG